MAARLLLASLVMLLLAACSPPPDRALVSRFDHNRDRFEQLRAAACGLGHDQLIRDWGTEPTIPDAQANWFRARLRDIGSSGLNVRQLAHGCALDLDVWSYGFAGTPADYKDFRYGALADVRDSMATMVVSDTDKAKLPHAIVAVERPLAGGWWIEYIQYP